MGKRMFDLSLAGICAVLLSPVSLVVAFSVLVFDGRPVVLKQVRAGLSGEPFTIYKFRTMSVAGDDAAPPLPDVDRITRLGSLLRRWHLDELPQLWNVIRGDMSLVGPRPLHLRYVTRYSPEQMRRHDIRPGLTGLAQVRGGGKMDWPSRFELDVWYVDNQSFFLDLRILGKTIVRTLSRRDTDDSTMEEFLG